MSEINENNEEKEIKEEGLTKKFVNTNGNT